MLPVTRLGADGSAFTGDTTISDGTVRVNSTLGGSVGVNGGTFGGSGTLTGSVDVADGTIAPGNSPGTLIIAGDLSLSSASILEFELGSPTGTAGVDSDLIDGGRRPDPRRHAERHRCGWFRRRPLPPDRLWRHADRNGLDIGTAPSGYDSTNLTVQTATVGQVNLLVDAALTYFWDGSNTSANNVVDGGTGTWDVSTTNWTTSDGSVNDVYNSSQLLIFAGAAGVVTVDGSAGDVVLQNGMQFAIDGYSVVGDAIGIDGANTIRVGDGTTAGAAYSATIASSLTGSGSLTKTDYGTLVLTGDSSGFTGDTDVDGGTLSITGKLVSTEGIIGSTTRQRWHGHGERQGLKLGELCPHLRRRLRHRHVHNQRWWDGQQFLWRDRLLCRLNRRDDGEWRRIDLYNIHLRCRLISAPPRSTSPLAAWSTVPMAISG